MNSILYGNFRLEVTAEGGSRANRLTRRASPGVPRPVRAAGTAPAVPPGRGEEAEFVRQAVRAQRPAGFFGTCGYGKTTLLRYVAASAVPEGLARASVYLRAGPGGLRDLLHRLVGELYAADQPVKLTPDECAQALSQVHALVVLDDIALTRAQADYLLSVLSGCSLLVSSPRPVLNQPGSSRPLAGLPGDAALQLVIGALGRPLTSGEMPAVRRLIGAVDGQPLHLRQAAALARDGRMSFAELATMAERDPEALDRRSVDALDERYRRALAILTIAAGALLPLGLVAAMGGIAEIGECLSLLHRRGLAEQEQDQFGLPVCKAERFRQMLLGDVHRAAALREYASWLATRDPTAPDSLSAASAALAIAEWAAEGGDWPGIVELVRVAEPILTLAGHWEASRQALTYGLTAATAAADHLSEALFTHQQGTLALCLDELTSAQELLSHALRLREQYGDSRGAAVTRHNLEILRSPAAAVRRRPPRNPRKLAVLAGSGLLTLLALTAGVVKAFPPGVAPTSTATPTPTPLTSSPHPTPSPSATGGSQGGGTTNQTGNGTAGGNTTGGTGTGGTGSAHHTKASSSAPSLTSVDFGLVDVTSGSQQPVQAVAVSNPNAQPLTITGASTLAPFTIIADKCLGRPIPAKGSCTIPVRFAPAALGQITQIFTVDSSAGEATSQLSGTGYAELSVSVTGAGSVSGSGISCPGTCDEQITTPPGGAGQVTLTATPGKSDIGITWGGDCQSDGSSATCSLSISADGNVTVTFAPSGGSTSPPPIG